MTTENLKRGRIRIVGDHRLKHKCISGTINDFGTPI